MLIGDMKKANYSKLYPGQIQDKPGKNFIVQLFANLAEIDDY